ncbi:MAG: ABC transporter substrate-binding protein [Lachnospiraceae bacterium]|nr:ABC transporter substrate-binding protein [Lachnospiraceae bacterium]
MSRHRQNMAMIAALLTGMMVLLSGCGGSADTGKETLTVLNYGDYIHEGVIKKFEKETGIEVKLEVASTPEEIYSKYESNRSKYDALCTSEYMLQKLISEGELIKADYSDMENIKDIGQEYWDFTKAFDPENKYVVPYFWGTVGLLYDKTRVKGDIESWDVIFNGEYFGDFIMTDSMRDAFMTALKYQRYSLNTTDEEELKKAQGLLLKQKSDVATYFVDEAKDEILKGKASIAVVYSGDAYEAFEENPDLCYCIPKEGSNLWIDCWGITKHCENVENAKKFIDFLCREDIALADFEAVKYSSPVMSVVSGMTEEERSSEALAPSPEKLDNCEVFIQLPEETMKYMERLWEEFKAE